MAATGSYGLSLPLFAPRAVISGCNAPCTIQHSASRKRRRNSSVLSSEKFQLGWDGSVASIGLPICTTFRKWRLGTGTRKQKKQQVTMALIAADSGSILYGVLAACAALGQVLSKSPASQNRNCARFLK